MSIIHAGIEALFGRNRDHHRKRSLFRLLRRNDDHKEENDELANCFSDKANTEKDLIQGDHFTYGAMQGWRSTMEDKHKHLTSLDSRSWKLWTYFSIFDGHNGIDTAKHAAEQLDIYLVNALNDMLNHHTDENVKNGEPVRSSQLDNSQLIATIKQTYYQLDLNLKSLVKDESGSVCITCLLAPDQIYLINIGDSRAIIIANDGRVLACTEDHKPDDPAEQERIHEAGGTISKTCEGDVLRVENQLAMTRVLGDFAIDKNIVPPMADIVQYPRDASAAYVVLACDGIWDVMSNEEVASYILDRASTIPMETIAAQLLDDCLRRQSTDNMSIYIIQL